MFTVGAIIDRPQTTAKPKRATNGRPYKQISAEDFFPLPICDIMGWVMDMDKEKEMPRRKHPRLTNYDYSSAGAFLSRYAPKTEREYSRISSNHR